MMQHTSVRVGLTVLFTVSALVGASAKHIRRSASNESVSVSASSGKLITAASCAYNDVQSAVNQAQIGDRVYIPAGTCTWDNNSAPYGSKTILSPDGIEIFGAGKNYTKIIKSNQGGDWEGMFQVDCKIGQPFKFHDLWLEGSGGKTSDVEPYWWTSDVGIYLRGKCRGVRIYDNRIAYFRRAGVQFRGDNGPVWGSPEGVIWNNEFDHIWDSNYNLGYSIVVHGSSEAWAKYATEVYGSPVERIYAEDNTSTNGMKFIDGNNGARFVARHNTITQGRPNSYYFAGAHGLSSWPTGARSFEIYDNVVDQTNGGNPVDGDGGYQYRGIDINGGDGIITRNTIKHVTTGIVVESNLGTPYPQRYQPRDVYVWDNTLSDVSYPTAFRGTVQEGRDVFQYSRGGYQEYIYPYPGR
jgi:hypothetical protein